MDDNGAWKSAATSATNGAHILSFQTFSYRRTGYRELGTDLTVVDASGKQPIVLLQGYQMQGSENTLYRRQVNGWR